MIVDLSNDDSFRASRRFVGPEVLEIGDFTGKIVLRNLPSGKRVHFYLASVFSQIWALPGEVELAIAACHRRGFS